MSANFLAIRKTIAATEKQAAIVQAEQEKAKKRQYKNAANCPQCQKIVEREKMFAISYRDITIAHIVRLKQQYESMGTAENSIELRDEQCVHSLISQQEEILQKTDFERQDTAGRRWKEMMRNENFMQSQIQICENCYLAFEDLVFFFASDARTQLFVRKHTGMKGAAPGFSQFLKSSASSAGRDTPSPPPGIRSPSKRSPSPQKRKAWRG